MNKVIAPIIVLTILSACTSKPERSPPLFDPPVFFAHYSPEYGDSDNLSLMPLGQISLPPLGVESIAGFNWTRHDRNDASWWNRIENFFYLLPFLSSDDPAHRDFAYRWFDGWYVTHKEQTPNRGSDEGMTVGQRVLVLVYMLDRAASESRPNAQRMDALTDAIGWHHDFLILSQNFESTSNHGMWQSLGLFETTRVVDRPESEDVALGRLLALTRKSVSSRGVHKEHSPSYHFTFKQWLSQFVPYLAALEADEATVTELRSFYDSMTRADYYLYDHDGTMPPIGDTAAAKQVMVARGLDPVADAFLLDLEAGYAIFKDPAGAVAHRYVVFNLQNEANRPELPFHFHDDVLAVYYSDDGEVILDDAGRFAYGESAQRAFFCSATAHNTVVAIPGGRVGSVPYRTPPLAETVTHREDAGADVVTATLNGHEVTRRVRVPRAESSIEIRDSFAKKAERTPFIILWNIGRDVVKIERQAGEHRAQWLFETRRGRRFELSIRAAGGTPVDARIIKGQQRPMLGWRSEGYRRMIPSAVVVVHPPADRPTTITTTVRPAPLTAALTTDGDD